MRKLSWSIAANGIAIVVATVTLAVVSPSRAQEIPTTPPQVAPPPPPSVNIATPLPIAPTNGLDQRLLPSLSTPQEGLITITPRETPALGVLPGGPGGSTSACTIGREGLALGLAQGSCADVVNFQNRDDLLK